MNGGILISGLDYLKYVTEQVTTYVDLPKEKKKKKPDKKLTPYYSNRWFGIVPFSLKTYFKKVK